MTSSHDVIELQHPFNFAIRRGETLTLNAVSKVDGKRSVTIRRSRSGRVTLEQIDHHGAVFVVELDAKGKWATLRRPGPWDLRDTEIMVPLILEGVTKIIRGVLLDDGGTLMATVVD